MTVQEIIDIDNKNMQETYPSGENHKGTKLQWFVVDGFRVWAINAQQALGVVHHAKVDAG